jgi:hypothetical protein
MKKKQKYEIQRVMHFATILVVVVVVVFFFPNAQESHSRTPLQFSPKKTKRGMKIQTKIAIPRLSMNSKLVSAQSRPSTMRECVSKVFSRLFGDLRNPKVFGGVVLYLFCHGNRRNSLYWRNFAKKLN